MFDNLVPGLKSRLENMDDEAKVKYLEEILNAAFKLYELIDFCSPEVKTSEAKFDDETEDMLLGGLEL